MGEGYTITQVAERTGLSTHTLRYYEQAGLIEPVARSPSGRRRYSASDIAHVQLLTTLRNSGMTVADVARYVQLSRSRPDDPELSRLLLKHRQEICAQLDHLRQALREIDLRLRTTPAREGGNLLTGPCRRLASVSPSGAVDPTVDQPGHSG